MTSAAAGEDMMQPAKVLRMLNEIGSRACDCAFLPGKANVVGDSFSRDPAERKELRALVDARGDYPRTLGEAFASIQSDTALTAHGDRALAAL
eukprot:5788088-Heterocapsa_arctica.AAC.1